MTPLENEAPPQRRERACNAVEVLVGLQTFVFCEHGGGCAASRRRGGRSGVDKGGDSLQRRVAMGEPKELEEVQKTARTGEGLACLKT